MAKKTGFQGLPAGGVVSCVSGLASWTPLPPPSPMESRELRGFMRRVRRLATGFAFCAVQNEDTDRLFSFNCSYSKNSPNGFIAPPVIHIKLTLSCALSVFSAFLEACRKPARRSASFDNSFPDGRTITTNLTNVHHNLF